MFEIVTSRALGEAELLAFFCRNRSRVEGDKRTELNRAVKLLPGYFGRCDRRALKEPPDSTPQQGDHRVLAPVWLTHAQQSLAVT